MLLLNREITVREADSKTNIAVNFDVPEGIESLRVNYSYYPKTVENRERALKLIADGYKKYGVEAEKPENDLPVNNLVTLSFDDCLGYRGACHRQPNEQTIIIGRKSTPGIINRPVAFGEWTVTLNVHYAGCSVKCKIEIEGIEYELSSL